jgi:membrane protease subunit HflC
MQAYRTSMTHGDTRLVLRPDSDFFRYFGDPSGKPAADGAAVLTAPPRSSSANK